MQVKGMRYNWKSAAGVMAGSFRESRGLSMTDKKKFYITTPIYYVNDKPHIGHAYTTILADVLARYHRLMGVPAFFLTGTDEHGQKVQQAAEKAGVTPQAHADSTVVQFQDLWKKLEITNDDFIRTTESRHQDIVKGILQDLFDRGEIYRAEYDGWYCTGDERFFMEKDLAEGKCPACGRTVEKVRESNYFFRMSRYQEWLIKYIEEHPSFIQPDFRRNETLGFLRKPLQDLCISRPKSRLSWGIELPFDSKFVCYVWFDALVNYVSTIGYRSDEARFSKWWPASYHLIGKDILTTHTVYWPTMLKAAGLPLPETVFAHGWWLLDDTKMSKSLGNVVNPMDMVEKYGVDPFRYFLLAEMTLGNDANFSEEAFVRRYNSDLANDLGNLLSRVSKMIESHCSGIIPSPSPGGENEKTLQQAVLSAAGEMLESVDRMNVDAGIAAVIGAVREANRYFEKSRPWTLASEGKKEELNTVLYSAMETLRIVAGALSPVMPSKMKELLAAIGMPGAVCGLPDLRKWGGLPPGTAIGAKVSLFPRIDAGKRAQDSTPAKQDVAPQVAKPAQEPAPGPESVSYDEFARIQLRTARILSAEKVQGADKLLRLEVDIGSEKRQIVAGVAMHYKPEDLPGKTIIVVANLKPAKIRGVESRGMLLAATDSAGKLQLVTVDGESQPGSIVK